MKHSQEFDAFTTLVDRVLAVPHSVIKRRVEEHRKQAALNPNRPGPKPKRKVNPSASSGRAAKDPQVSAN
ncbi:MAG: hypothetical protein ABI811_05950 [Acidobacteriota bacterium]